MPRSLSYQGNYMHALGRKNDLGKFQGFFQFPLVLLYLFREWFISLLKSPIRKSGFLSFCPVRAGQKAFIPLGTKRPNVMKPKGIGAFAISARCDLKCLSISWMEWQKSIFQKIAMESRHALSAMNNSGLEAGPVSIQRISFLCIVLISLS